MTTQERWERIAGLIAGAGIETRGADRRSYPGGSSYSITLPHPDGGIVRLHDTWWRKNHDVWTGYEIYREGPDSIQRGRSVRTKNRAGVVTSVTAFLNAA